MLLQLFSQSGELSSSTLELEDSVFACPYNQSLVHQAVVAYGAGGRQGSKAQKNRSDVSGGGAKPFKQKGSGRARAGTTRGPLWRKGGVTFAARPRDHQKKLNKSMYRAALSSVLSELFRDGRIVVLDNFSLPSCKTSGVVSFLKNFSANQTLLVLPEASENVLLASRNISFFNVKQPSQLDLPALIHAGKIFFTAESIGLLQQRLL